MNNKLILEIFKNFSKAVLVGVIVGLASRIWQL
jgi:hypothetical protein